MEDDPYAYDSVPMERKRVTFKCCDDKNAELDRLRAQLSEWKEQFRVLAILEQQKTARIAELEAEAKLAADERGRLNSRLKDGGISGL